MERRAFLAMLGLAPLAAKVAFDDFIVKELADLSSAYDYRFGSPAILGHTYDVVALQLEKVRHLVPVLYENPSGLWHLLNSKERFPISNRRTRIPRISPEPLVLLA